MTDGSVHKAKAVLRVTHGPEGSYCVEGILESLSTPGASVSSWSGDLHEGELKIFNIDVTGIGAAIKERALSRFIQFMQMNKPARTDTPLETSTYTCTNPCQGGKIHNTRQIASARLYQHITYHLYGEHSFTSGGASWSPETEAHVTVPIASFSSTSDLWAIFTSELGNDIAEEKMDEIEEAYRSGGS